MSHVPFHSKVCTPTMLLLIPCNNKKCRQQNKTKKHNENVLWYNRKKLNKLVWLILRFAILGTNVDTNRSAHARWMLIVLNMFADFRKLYITNKSIQAETLKLKHWSIEENKSKSGSKKVTRTMHFTRSQWLPNGNWLLEAVNARVQLS